MRQTFDARNQTLYGDTGTTFEIGRSLGFGGMGQVYLAQQRTDSAGAGTGQLLALKILHQSARLQARRLFYHEGTLLPRLRHQNIVHCTERGRGAIPGAGTVDYLALEFITGETTEALLQRYRSPLPPATSLGIIAQIAGALGYLHQRGIVHCDLKPANIMIERATPRAVLIDFGIARAPDFVGQPVAVGTPQYMAPEQADVHAHCDGRADIYALGAVTYELLTGRRLFPRRTTTDIQKGILVALEVSDLSSMLGDSVVQVIARCLRRHPNERYPTAEAMLADLRRALCELHLEQPLLDRAIGA
jgi:eukaryotic-like serine/threonine-protein kinase